MYRPFDLSIQRWDEIEDDVRRAHLSTMPDCTEDLSRSYCFIVDRLDASLAAASAANAASRAAARVAIKSRDSAAHDCVVRVGNPSPGSVGAGLPDASEPSRRRSPRGVGAFDVSRPSAPRIYVK